VTLLSHYTIFGDARGRRDGDEQALLVLTDALKPEEVHGTPSIAVSREEESWP